MFRVKSARIIARCTYVDHPISKTIFLRVKYKTMRVVVYNRSLKKIAIENYAEKDSEL